MPATHENGPAYDEEDQEGEDARHDDEQHVVLQKAHGVTQEVRFHVCGPGRRGLVVRGEAAVAQNISEVAEFFPAWASFQKGVEK